MEVMRQVSKKHFRRLPWGCISVPECHPSVC